MAKKAIAYIESIDTTEAGPQPHIVLLDLNLPRKSGARAYWSESGKAPNAAKCLL